MKLTDFNNISEDMIWKGAAQNQIKWFQNLQDLLKVAGTVVATHRSKSIDLPVVEFQLGADRFRLRDNFYNVNIHCRLAEPSQLSIVELFQDLYSPMTWAWYLEEIKCCRNYTYAGFTEEQMEDPDFLGTPHPRVTKEAKARWINRMTDPAWWTKDWSSGFVTTEDPFGPQAKLYVQAYPFREGLPGDGDDYYQKGAQTFCLVAHPDEGAALIKRLHNQKNNTPPNY